MAGLGGQLGGQQQPGYQYENHSFQELLELFQERRYLGGLPLLPSQTVQNLGEDFRLQDRILILRIQNYSPALTVTQAKIDEQADWQNRLHTLVAQYNAEYTPEAAPAYPTTTLGLVNLYETRRRLQSFSELPARRPNTDAGLLAALQDQDTRLLTQIPFTNYIVLTNARQVDIYLLLVREYHTQVLLKQAQQELQEVAARGRSPSPHPAGMGYQPMYRIDPLWQNWWDGLPPSQQLENLWNEMSWYLESNPPKSFESFRASLNPLNMVPFPPMGPQTILPFADQNCHGGNWRSYNPNGRPWPDSVANFFDNFSNSSFALNLVPNLNFYLDKLQSFSMNDPQNSLRLRDWLTLAKFLSYFGDAMRNRIEYQERGTWLGSTGLQYQPDSFDLIGIRFSDSWVKFFAEYQFTDADAEPVFRQILLQHQRTAPREYIKEYQLNYTPIHNPFLDAMDLYQTIINTSADNAVDAPAGTQTASQVNNTQNKPKNLKSSMWAEQHFAWWGDFIEDGPQYAWEEEYLFLRRQYCARDNMRIERRLRPRLEPNNNDNARQATETLHEQEAQRVISEHKARMAPGNPQYNEFYKRDFQLIAQQRHALNNWRREDATEYRNREAFRLNSRNRDKNPPKLPLNDVDFYEDEGEDYYRDPPPIRAPHDIDIDDEDDEDRAPRRRCPRCIKAHVECTALKEPDPTKRFPCDYCKHNRDPNAAAECVADSREPQRRAITGRGPYLISYWARNTTGVGPLPVLEDLERREHIESRLPRTRRANRARGRRGRAPAPRPRGRSRSVSPLPPGRKRRSGAGRPRGVTKKVMEQRLLEEQADRRCRECRNGDYSCDGDKEDCRRCRLLGLECIRDFEDQPYQADPPAVPSPPPDDASYETSAEGVTYQKCQNCIIRGRTCSTSRPCTSCILENVRETCDPLPGFTPEPQQQGSMNDPTWTTGGMGSMAGPSWTGQGMFSTQGQISAQNQSMFTYGQPGQGLGLAGDGFGSSNFGNQSSNQISGVGVNTAPFDFGGQMPSWIDEQLTQEEIDRQLAAAVALPLSPDDSALPSEQRWQELLGDLNQYDDGSGSFGLNFNPYDYLPAQSAGQEAEHVYEDLALRPHVHQHDALDTAASEAVPQPTPPALTAQSLNNLAPIPQDDTPSSVDDLFTASPPGTPTSKPLKWRFDKVGKPRGRAGLFEFGQCTENVDFWLGEGIPPHRACPKRDAYRCEHALCAGWACDDCHKRQRDSEDVKKEEGPLIKASKAGFCEECEIETRSAKVKGGALGLYQGRCHCVLQLQATWVCNSHRLDLRQEWRMQVRARAAERTESGLEGFCGRCEKNRAERKIEFWKCIVCGKHVTQAP